LQFPVAEHHHPGLLAMGIHLPATAFPRLRRPTGRLLGGQSQHRLDSGPPGGVDQLVTGALALLDQVDHRQQE
jgi:hypothetical protein